MTKSQRTKLIAIIDKTTNYDAASVRVTKDGKVTARLDANKTFNGPHNTRVFVGYANEIMRAA